MTQTSTTGTDLRAEIARVLRDHQPPTHVDSEGLPPDEFECCADAVLAAIKPLLAERDRPRKDIYAYRCPTPCDPDCEHRCHEGHQVPYKQRHNVAECQARCAAAEAYRRFAPKAGQGAEALVLPNAAFDELAGQLEPPAQSVPELVALFRRPRVTPPADADVIAPQDERVSSADVAAQTEVDQHAYCPDCGHPETNCACG